MHRKEDGNGNHLGVTSSKVVHIEVDLNIDSVSSFFVEILDNLHYLFIFLPFILTVKLTEKEGARGYNISTEYPLY
jgi:hypothetical protein